MNTKLITTKINAAKKTKKLTKAMETISALKINKYKKDIFTVNNYLVRLETICNAFSGEELTQSMYTKKKTEGKDAIILITSDKGLCGSYNVNIYKLFKAWQKQNNISQSNIAIICIGKKGAQFVVRSELDLTALILNMDRENVVETAEWLTNLIVGRYVDNTYKSVSIIYTAFESALNQAPEVLRILPLEIENSAKEQYKLVEEENLNLIDTLLEDKIKALISKCLVESITSEHTARANSMKNATEAAQDFIDDLTILYNKERQALVTREIIEISSFAETI